jgi:probable HAF family extracellular repeat protein
LGTDGTPASGINNAGRIVGTYSDGSDAFHGFLSKGSTYTTP